MEVQKRNTILIALIAIFAVVVLVLAIMRLIGGATYVRIVDTSAERSLSGSAPGADIDAIAIEKWQDGERTKAWYAEVVQKDPYAATEEDSTDTAEDAPVDAEEEVSEVSQQYADANAALGDPEADEKTEFVALNGKEIVVKVPKRLRKGLTLTVHEIGSVNAARADSYDVYTSNSPDGPWELRGTGSGPFSVEITD